MNILQEIAERTQARIDEEKKLVIPKEIKELALSMPTDMDFPFEQALKSDDIAFICEVKKASPSKGIIAEDFPHVQIAKDYEAAGAAAISVLTEPFWFKGSDDFLREISDAVKIPLLRKDFTVDDYMLYQAKILGAHAVLLICSILDAPTLKKYMDISQSLGLSVLAEAHDEHEVETAISAGARIIGVNNRNLKTFDVDITLSERLKKLVPPEIIFVSESGISQPAEINNLRKIGANAALVGESIMRSSDKKRAINILRGGVDPTNPRA